MNNFEKKAFKYCFNGAEESFMGLVPTKVDINFQIQNIEFNRFVLESPSFLHCAAAHAKERMTMLLVDLGIDLDLRDAKGIYYLIKELLLALHVIMAILRF